MLLGVLGVLLALIGLGFLLVGQAAGSLKDISGTFGEGSGFAVAFGSVVTIVGGFFIVAGIVQVIAGVGAWTGREWGRFIGIVYGILGSLFFIATIGSPRSGNGALDVAVLLLVAYVYITAVLALRWKGRTAT